MGNHFGPEIARIFLGTLLDTVQKALEILEGCEETEGQTHRSMGTWWNEREYQQSEQQDSRNYRITQRGNDNWRRNDQNRKVDLCSNFIRGLM